MPDIDPRHHDLLVALAADGSVPRASACRLAATVDVWADGAEEPAELARRVGVPKGSLVRALALRARAGEVAEAARRTAVRFDAHIVPLGAPGSPPELFDLHQPPPALWVRGDVPPPPRLAMVGSRRMSWIGRRAAELFARDLAATGITIVSGFARGVDATAHDAAIAVPGGRTVAILGCGLDVDYPRRSRRRAEAIADAGALVTEFPPGTGPRAGHFPQRNRIIAALSSAVLVVQAALRSGSLVTARHALELGRDVWAVPGEIFDETAKGTNALIADGAFVARRPRDLIEAFEAEGAPIPGTGPPADDATRPAPAGPAGEIVELCRSEGPRTVEEIAAACDLGVERVLTLLLDLELDGCLRREPGPRWRLGAVAGASARILPP